MSSETLIIASVVLLFLATDYFRKAFDVPRWVALTMWLSYSAPATFLLTRIM